jgi:uncharacterized protein
MTAAKLKPDWGTGEQLNAIQNIAAYARFLRARGLNDTEDVPSPCISVCRVDARSGLCDGCMRTLDEISAWSRLDRDAKRDVWQIIEQRAAVSLAASNGQPGEAT